MSNDWEQPEHTDALSDDGSPWLIPEPLRLTPDSSEPTPAQSPPAWVGRHAPTAHPRRMVVAAVAIAGLVTTGAGIGIVAKIASLGRGGGTSSLADSSAPGATAGNAPVALPAGPDGPDGSGQFGSGSPGDDVGHGDGGGAGASSGGQTTASTPATAAQLVGIVDVNTVLGLQSARAAGTGMVLTPTGEILTNNHVIDGATSVSVTVVATGTTYRATVVGYDPTQDVAVLQASGASGLATITPAQALPSVGTSVTGVGNAGGAGGTPSAARGTVVAVGQTITATDDNGAGAERLTGLIQTNAAIAAGDSGGPLLTSNNEVLGMDTAASTGGSAQAFAIPIGRALALAAIIEAGQPSSTVHIGGTALLGVGVPAGTRAVVASVLSGSPAAAAGLSVGDVITSVGGVAITTSSGLRTALASHAPGQQVTIGFVDQSGTAHRATVTLASGPAV